MYCERLYALYSLIRAMNVFTHSIALLYCERLYTLYSLICTVNVFTHSIALYVL